MNWNSFIRVEKNYFFELRFEFGKTTEFFLVRSPEPNPVYRFNCRRTVQYPHGGLAAKLLFVINGRMIKLFDFFFQQPERSR